MKGCGLMKHSIEWHENSLHERREKLAKKAEKFDRVQDEFVSEVKAIDVYAAQIQVAKENKKRSFDEKRYGVKKCNLI
mgnify:CR=1 FL=1